MTIQASDRLWLQRQPELVRASFGGLSGRARGKDTGDILRSVLVGDSCMIQGAGAGKGKDADGSQSLCCELSPSYGQQLSVDEQGSSDARSSWHIWN